MANRIKTIQYAFPMNTGVIANTTTTNLAQITIYIPEVVISFRSVTVDVGFQDIITATGGTITEHRVGLRLGAAAYATITETDDIANSGENIAGVIGPFNFTSHFTTNWSGTYMTCDLQAYFSQSTGTTLGMRNVTATIVITYEYNDTATTQIKTAYIPLESLAGALTTTTNSDIGASQIPQLTGAGGILPEGGVIIRDYYFIIEGNESTSATTDFTLRANIDGGTAMVFGVQEAALSSCRYCRWIYKPAIPTTTTTHNFQLWSSLAARLNHVSITLIVTYAFNEPTTTRVLNSIIFPIEIASPLGATSATEASRFLRDFFIEEPGVITMMQSAFRINYNCTATPTGLRFRAGTQAFRAYTPYANMVVGMFCLQQRIDSGSSLGAGITLSRGKNTLVIDGYTTITTDQVTNINGYVIINYQSDKSSAGIGAHSHTVFHNLLQWDALLTDRVRFDATPLIIPENNYYNVGAGFIFYQFVATASQAITFDVEVLAGEGKGGGYQDIYADAYQSDAERSCSIVWMRGRDVFKRYPNDQDIDRISVQISRGYRLFTSTTTANGLMSVWTYHSNIFNVSGNITGSAGGTITIKTYRSDNNELINTTTRIGNGTYSFVWYDNTIPIYSEAHEDSTHIGRSVTATSDSLLNISLSRQIARSYA